MPAFVRVVYSLMVTCPTVIQTLNSAGFGIVASNWKCLHWCAISAAHNVGVLRYWICVPIESMRANAMESARICDDDDDDFYL